MHVCFTQDPYVTGWTINGKLVMKTVKYYEHEPDIRNWRDFCKAAITMSISTANLFPRFYFKYIIWSRKVPQLFGAMTLVNFLILFMFWCMHDYHSILICIYRYTISYLKFWKPKSWKFVFIDVAWMFGSNMTRRILRSTYAIQSFYFYFFCLSVPTSQMSLCCSLTFFFFLVFCDFTSLKFRDPKRF